MKFKLINENTRGLNARPSQRALNEEAYYKISYPPYNDTNYFYMVATNEADVRDKIINKSKHEKHEIYRNIVGFNPDEYSVSGKRNIEELKIASATLDQLKANPSRVFVSSHRTLRDRAHKSVNTKDSKSKYLVHHIDGDEFNNDKSNLLGIENTSSDYYIAQGIHKILHNLENLTRENISQKSYRHNCIVYSESGELVPAILEVKFDLR